MLLRLSSALCYWPGRRALEAQSSTKAIMTNGIIWASHILPGIFPGALEKSMLAAAHLDAQPRSCFRRALTAKLSEVGAWCLAGCAGWGADKMYRWSQHMTMCKPSKASRRACLRTSTNTLQGKTACRGHQNISWGHHAPEMQSSQRPRNYRGVAWVLAGCADLRWKDTSLWVLDYGHIGTIYIPSLKEALTWGSRSCRSRCASPHRMASSVGSVCRQQVDLASVPPPHQSLWLGSLQ